VRHFYGLATYVKVSALIVSELPTRSQFKDPILNGCDAGGWQNFGKSRLFDVR